MPKLISTCLAGLLTAALLTGCTGPGPVASPASPVTPTVSTPAGPPSLSDDDLYALAVSQYKKLFAIMTDVDRHGGATVLPDASRDVMMDPAWAEYDRVYREILLSGDRYVGAPKYTITAIGHLDGEQLADDTIIALQTCELFEGAAMLDQDGNTVQDGSPVMRYLKAYLKYDPADGELKVFILNGEGVDTCPIN